jgi:aminodeoxyfutalosine deaminase
VILKAPLILPVDGPPIKDGAVVVEEETIAAVGPFRKIREDSPEKFTSAVELSDTVLLPGFVNAHSHLELTALRGFPYPGGFSQWIRKIVAAKPGVSTNDTARAIEEGIHWMLQTGTTTVGDHVSVGTDFWTILKSPLRGRLFIEILGVRREVAEDLLSIARDLERIFEKNSGRFHVNASPHSAHAVHPKVLPSIFESHRPLFSIHLAESDDEQALFEKNAGPLFDLIGERGTPLRFNQPSPLAYLEALNLLSDRVTAVHGNYFKESDAELLLKHRMSVVHCPTSHAYFSHPRFPLPELKRKGINVALGTDSLASGHSLSMLDQLQTAAKSYPEILPEEWIRMATINGAKALKMENEIGTLTPGKKADLIGIKVPEGALKNVLLATQAVLSAEKVEFSIISGQGPFY